MLLAYALCGPWGFAAVCAWWAAGWLAAAAVQPSRVPWRLPRRGGGRLVEFLRRAAVLRLTCMVASTSSMRMGGAQQIGFLWRMLRKVAAIYQWCCALPPQSEDYDEDRFTPRNSIKASRAGSSVLYLRWSIDTCLQDCLSHRPFPMPVCNPLSQLDADIAFLSPLTGGEPHFCGCGGIRGGTRSCG